MQSLQMKMLCVAAIVCGAVAHRANLRYQGDDDKPKVCLPKNAVPGTTADEKCSHMSAFQAAFTSWIQTSQPGYKPYPEHAADDYTYEEVHSKDCKEPKNGPHSFDGAGPPVIYCCHTAQEKVAKFEEREVHCDSDPPVPCWKTLVKAIPTYLMYYRSRVADLCKTTTTTTTPTVTNATNKTQESIVKNVTGSVNQTDGLAEDFHAFCMRKCEKMTVRGEDRPCKPFCDVLNERHQEEKKKHGKKVLKDAECKPCDEEAATAGNETASLAKMKQHMKE